MIKKYIATSQIYPYQAAGFFIFQKFLRLFLKTAKSSMRPFQKKNKLSLAITRRSKKGSEKMCGQK